MALRKCKICGFEATAEQDLEKFIPNKHSKYGRYNFCKQCYPNHVRPYHRKYNNTHRLQHQQYYFAHREDQNKQKKERWLKRKQLAVGCTQKELEYARKYRLKSFVLRRARKQAWDKIPLKLTCARCGQTDVKLERHHPDYSQALLVTTLCRSCHEQIHSQEFWNEQVCRWRE